MTPAVLGILLWLVVRAVRARRRGASGGASGRALFVPALPITALPRATAVVILSVAGAILATGANGRTALQTLDGLLILAGFVALVLRLVPWVTPRVGWATNLALGIVAGDFLGFMLAEWLHAAWTGR